MRITIDFRIYSINLAKLQQLYPGEYKDLLTARNEAYYLLAYLSTLYNNIKIADIGSRTGNSALSLSYNESNHVHSYDIDINRYNQCCNDVKKQNITFHCKDVIESDEILQYPLIHLDVDPHDGIQEERCFNFLLKNNYKGVLILDDINFPHVFPQLKIFWDNIKLPKWDVSRYGHYSGTGIVDFTKELEINYVL